jgi:hypothetical protein
MFDRTPTRTLLASHRRRPRRGAPALAATLAAAVLVTAAAVVATLLTPAPASAAPFGDREEVEQLVSRLEERYDLLELRESYVLRPADGADAGFDVIEVGAGTVALDGEEVAPERLREVIGDDADLVFELAELGLDTSLAELRRLAETQERNAQEIEERIQERLEELERRQEEAAERAAETTERRVEAEESRRERRRRIETDTRVSFGSSLTVEENEIAREVVVIGGSVDVRGEVQGDAVAIGGSVEIQGRVSGNVTAVGGSVSLGPEARVHGEVVAVGGAVDRDPGAEVYGQVTELSFLPWGGIDGWEWDHGPWHNWSWRSSWLGAWTDVVHLLFTTFLLTAVVLLIVFVGRGYVSEIADRAALEPWKAGMVGLAVQVLFFPVLLVIFILLMISLVGIPLALILLPLSLLALAILLLLGYPGVALCTGRWVQERFRIRSVDPFLAVLLGIAVIQGWRIVGEALSFVGGPIWFTAVILIVLGILIKYVAWTIGLGAVLLHRFSPLPAAPGPALPPPAPPEPGDAPELPEGAEVEDDGTSAEESRES